jgi:hypothetical protein
MVAAAVTAAIIYIPQIETHLIRYAAWAIYGYAMGLVGTGLWVCEIGGRSSNYMC